MSTARTSVRTYWKRRLGALFGVAVVAWVLYAGAGADATAPAVSYTVAPGDTLWSIATTRYSPANDPRTKIEAIRKINDMEGYAIQAGSRLKLPRER